VGVNTSAASERVRAELARCLRESGPSASERIPAELREPSEELEPVAGAVRDPRDR
jgi:hypothetical protein